MPSTEPSIGEEEWVEMHEKVERSLQNNWSKKGGEKLAGLGRVTWRKTQKKAQQINLFLRKCYKNSCSNCGTH